MVPGVVHCIATAAGAFAAAAALLLTAAPAAASATPPAVAPVAPPAVAPVAAAAAPAAPKKPAKPDTVTITGGKTPEGGLTVHAAEDAQLFDALYGQVSWLADAAPQMSAPDRGKLGEKYTLVVWGKNAPQQTYEVYPDAKGGPRAYRPAKQPTGRVTAGWFYGRLSMSETLRESGVPLRDGVELLTGGIGGGGRVSTPEVVDYGSDVNAFVGELRQLVLLNGAVVLTIAIGLAGMSYLIRRKV